MSYEEYMRRSRGSRAEAEEEEDVGGSWFSRLLCGAASPAEGAPATLDRPRLSPGRFRRATKAHREQQGQES